MVLRRRVVVAALVGLVCLPAAAGAATRLYLTTNAAPFQPTPATGGAQLWHDQSTTNSAAMATTRAGTHTAQNATEAVNNSAYKLLVTQMVSDQPLRGGTWIDGTVNLVIKTAEAGGTAGTANATTILRVWVATGANPDFAARRCEILTGAIGSPGDFGGANTSYEWGNGSATMTGVGANGGAATVLTGTGSCSSTGGTQPRAGDYLVVEIGARTDSNATLRSMSVGIGGTSATPLAHGDTDTTRASWIEWSDTFEIGTTYTPTPTATGTRTPTPSATGTVTATRTPTLASGCHRVTFTPAASADDAVLQSQDNASATIDTNTTTQTFGIFRLFNLFNIEAVSVFRFHTAPSIPDNATVTAAWLNLYTTAYQRDGGTRRVLGKWTSGQGAWTTGDFEDELTPANAADFTAPASVPLNTYSTINLSNPSQVDIAGSYTGIKLGSTNPGAPTTSDGWAWVVSSVDGAHPPVLVVDYCNPTPTPTVTATATHTATPLPVVQPQIFLNSPTGTATTTATPTRTGTPTLPATMHRCPDNNYDGQCGVLLLGTSRTAGVFPWLAWLAPSAAMLCDATAAGMTSGQMRALVDGLSASDTCTSLGGTVVRGADIPPDLVLIDVGALAIAEQVHAITAPSAEHGICHGPDTPCRIEAPGGLVDTWQTGPHAKCAGGPNWRTPCVPGAGDCAADEHPTDPFRSLCQPWLYGDGENGVRVTDCPERTCQQRPHVHVVYDNVIAATRRLREHGRAVVWMAPWQVAEWGNRTAEQPVATAATPDGNAYPNVLVAAMHEVAAPILRLVRSWIGAHRLIEQTGEVAFVDLQRHFELTTDGQPWVALGDQTNLATEAQAGRCTCYADAHCGVGGACTSGACTAGPRSSCATDAECLGGDSQQMPGTANCLRDRARQAAQAIHACIEDLATDMEPEWETSGVLCCSEPCIRRHGKPAWPTRTGTPTHTVTPTVTVTATLTSTPGPGTPTESPTPGPSPTATQTSPVPLKPSATLAVGDLCRASKAPGNFATMLTDAMRRTVTNYADCFFQYTQQLVTSPVCDLVMGTEPGNGQTPDTAPALIAPNPVAFRTNNELRRIEMHAWRDKTPCENWEYYLMSDWIRYRAYQLALPVPAPLSIDYHVWPRNDPSDPDPWDVYPWLERWYVLPWINQIRADLSATPMVVSAKCAGFAMNQIGFGAATDWLNADKPTKCEGYYSSVANKSYCAGIMPPKAVWDTWCQGYRDMLLPVYQGFRAAAGWPCGSGCP